MNVCCESAVSNFGNADKRPSMRTRVRSTNWRASSTAPATCAFQCRPRKFSAAPRRQHNSAPRRARTTARYNPSKQTQCARRACGAWAACGGRAQRTAYLCPASSKQLPTEQPLQTSTINHQTHPSNTTAQKQRQTKTKTRIVCVCKNKTAGSNATSKTGATSIAAKHDNEKSLLLL